MTALLEAGARVSRWLAWVGGAMLLLSAALVSLDVIFRSLWKVSYFESFELSTYAFAIATALGMSYALASKAHIRIELLYVLLPQRARAWLDVLAVDPSRLRIAFASTGPGGVPLHPHCVAAVHDAARLCESLGHAVEEASPDFDAGAMAQAFRLVFSANTAANVARATGGAPPTADQVEPLTAALAAEGARISATQFIGGLHAMHRQGRRLATFFERYDLWLTPTLAQPPLPHGHFDIRSPDVDAWFERICAFLPFTYPFNISGQPAASVPLFWSDDGLPIGVQFAARAGDEALLLRLAAQLERARPWFGRRPVLR